VDEDLQGARIVPIECSKPGVQLST
jgi:hypothetical protein